MTEYTYRLSDAELARYRAMAARALAREETLWTAAGIVPGARVVDLGCGPGMFLADLAERVGSLGRVTGVDDAEEAVRTAGALVEQLGGRRERRFRWPRPRNWSRAVIMARVSAVPAPARPAVRLT